MVIFHITTRQEVAIARKSGTYAPKGFNQEGFIHCSYGNQLLGVAHRLFRNQQDLLVLQIDTDLLDCAIVDENLEGGTELFPHIYGVLPLTAVAKVHDFPCDQHGKFELPQAIAYFMG